MIDPKQKKDIFGFFETSSFEQYRPGNPNRADEEDNILPVTPNIPKNKTYSIDYNPDMMKDFGSKKPNPLVSAKPNNKSSNKPAPISFEQALSEAKSAAQNKTSIADIERKTARVAAMIGMSSPLDSSNSGESNSNTSNNSVSNNNNSTTIVSSDYVSGLRRDYEQMPSWRVNVG